MSKIKTIFMLFFMMVFLTACVWPVKEDPFKKINNLPRTELQGTLYPFSVSVSTSATHRLEKDNKLVAYIASDIIQLGMFENREVTLSGVFREEKMRQIFWADKIDVQNIELNKAPKTHERYTNGNVSFVYPLDWEYAEAADGILHFTQKTDPQKKVFLMFDSQSSAPEDREVDGVIASIPTIKSTSEIGTNSIREKIFFLPDNQNTLAFTLISKKTDYELQKEFRKMMNSFVFGAKNIEAVLADEKIKEAEAKALELKRIQEIEELNKLATEINEESPETKEGSTPDTAETTPTPDKAPAEKTPKEEKFPNLPVEKKATNLKMDSRAFAYNSNYYGFNLKVPYGLWFRNFGPTSDSIMTMGFATRSIESQSDVDFWMKIKSGQPSSNQPITKVRDAKSYFMLEGGNADLMQSILDSIAIN